MRFPRTTVGELADSIMEYLAARNRDPKRYVWKAKGVAILEKIEMAKIALNSILQS